MADSDDFSTWATPQGELPLPVLSVVIPCYNEEAVILATHSRLSSVLEGVGRSYEVIYVDDGSQDSTRELLGSLVAQDRAVRVVGFSRNFGHEAASTAGIAHARGRAVVVMDADLQDPPELISKMVELWDQGFQVVYAQRVSRRSDTAFKRLAATLFYRLLSRLTDVAIPRDTGDFRLMDRKVVDAFLSMPEHNRFVRGMIAWTGFRQIALPFERPKRFAGMTKYPTIKGIRLAISAILAFSTVPLRLAAWLGAISAFLSLVGIIYALASKLVFQISIPGWASVFIAILFLGGVQLLSLGIIGEYIGVIYEEVKGRPLYVVQERLPLNEEVDK